VEGYQSFPWDLTPWAAGNPEFHFRFRYEDTDLQGDWSVDDVEISILVHDACSTGDSLPPVVAISDPQDDSSFPVGTDILFAGSATDPEDGDLGAGLAWTSNLDGPIGTGISFSFSGLSQGEHEILAEVTDSSGLTGSDSVSIEVGTTGAIEAPSRLRAMASRRAPAINLRWADNSDDETRFEIERSLDHTSGFALIGEVGEDVTKYTDNGLQDQTTYYYRVRACAVDTCSSYSNVADATTY
jgi:hypothetical protein